MKITKVLATFLALCLLLSSLVACNTDNNNPGQELAQKTENTPEVNNIFLSKSEITLDPGEKINLIATVSPGNIEVNLTWSSSNDNIAIVNDQGTVTAIAEGDAVIRVEAPNGIIAVCNVTVKVKIGRVTGTVTYKYNDFVGNKADTGATVILVSKSVKVLPDSFGLGLWSYAPKGCYIVKVDGAGNYTFDNIPVGEYYLVIISNNTTDNIYNVSVLESWGSISSLFSEKGRENALLTAQVHKTRNTSITVFDGQTTTYSYDFGITCT